MLETSSSIAAVPLTPGMAGVGAVTSLGLRPRRDGAGEGTGENSGMRAMVGPSWLGWIAHHAIPHGR